MYDPLSSTSAFGGQDVSDTPPWPTTPHSPNSPIPNLRRATSPIPPAPDKGPSPGLYGKEPQIYGQPEPGLISPRETVASNGTAYEKQEPYLRVRITGLDRNRRDILIKLDAQTNLSNFTGTTYRNVSRSYLEFQQFYESVVHNNPQTIVPALPLAQTSAPTDEEDDRLVKITLQRWMTRICEDPILLHDEDLRSFIESDFGYQPTPRPRKKASSGFSLIRRGVPDEDEELQRARFELTKLEGQFFETAKAVDKLAIMRKALATTHAEMGNKLINVASTEAHPPLGNAMRKIGRTWHSVADLDQAQAISECVIIGDSLGYQGMNARSAKETLQMRTGVLEEYQAAVKTTISKRRHIERLKASSNIRPDKVDEALEDMEEANKYEQVLARRADGISQNLHQALQTHNRHANDDITTALIEHARSSVMYERQLLRELEALRVDVANAAKKVAPSANGVPMPTVIPPLEDFSTPAPAPQTAPISNGYQQRPYNIQNPPRTAESSYQYRAVSPPQRPASQGPPSQGSSAHEPLSYGPLSASTIPVAHSQLREPLSASSAQTFSSLQASHGPIPGQATPTSTPGAGPSSSHGPSQTSTPKPNLAEGPSSGRFVDGTRSMFNKPVASPSMVSPIPPSNSNPTSSSQAPIDPLRSNSYPQPHQSYLHQSVSQNSVSQGIVGASTDPFGQFKPQQMSSSVRVQPTRPRLDPREAASKLANMF